MKVLYIGRHPATRHNSYWMQWLYKMRDSYYLDNQIGFFLASLKTQADVRQIGINTLHNMTKDEVINYDVILFNHLCNDTPRKPGFDVFGESIRNLEAKLSGLPKVLLLATDDSAVMPTDDLLDRFQLIFKREPYKDLNRYDLAPRNLDKIRSTVLSCHLVRATIFNYKTLRASDYGDKEVSKQYRHDLFFSGLDTSNLRRRVMRHLVESEFDITGGIHKKNKPVPKELEFSRLSKKKFYETIRSSKINLAIEGYGQFTYRHWELWCLSAFLISSPSLREIQLPFEIREGEHYVTYDNFEDLSDKISYYLDHPDERFRIARNGRKLFENEYDFYKHGRKIHQALEQELF